MLPTLGVTRVLTTSAVGSLTPSLPPGALALLSDILDFSVARRRTFAEEHFVLHIDVTAPYCPALRRAVLEGARAQRIPLFPRATYICAEGARFETPAEIRAFQRLGADVVGMTGAPEFALAREAGLCYASIAIVTNWAAGLSSAPLSHQEVALVMKEARQQVMALLEATLNRIPSSRTCACGEAPKRARVFP